MARMTRLSNAAALRTLFGMTPETDLARLKLLANMARTEWVAESRVLVSSQSAYRAGIQPEVVEQQGGKANAYIVLSGTLPNMVEQGCPPFDLRETVLKSPKAHTSKAGYRYMAIPFRHMLPGATGRNAPAIGSAYAGSKYNMGNLVAMGLAKAVTDLAKKLRGKKRIGEADGGPLLRDRHVTGIYTGMQRQTKQYEKATQAKYGTFRMISTNPASMRSDAGGMNWMHPGIKARHLADRVQERIPDLASMIWGGTM
jgi:hypothetical protein